MLLIQEMIFDSFGESKWVEIFKVIRDSLPKIYSLVLMRSFVCQHLFSFEFYAILCGRILNVMMICAASILESWWHCRYC